MKTTAPQSTITARRARNHRCNHGRWFTTHPQEAERLNTLTGRSRSHAPVTLASAGHGITPRSGYHRPVTVARLTLGAHGPLPMRHLPLHDTALPACHARGRLWFGFFLAAP